MNNVKGSIFKLVSALIVFTAIGMAGSVWAYEHQSNSANSVHVDVVPIQLTSGKLAKFEIRMNTHSVQLNYDMTAASLLKDDQGREYRQKRHHHRLERTLSNQDPANASARGLG